jgi:hypothetical protein
MKSPNAILANFNDKKNLGPFGADYGMVELMKRGHNNSQKP